MDIVNTMVGENENIRIVSEEDKGIYDAMNQAVGMATGEYIYFLNAGDSLYDEHTLEQVHRFISKEKIPVIYGNIIQISDKGENLRKYGNICHKKFYYLTGDCICHQAMFARRNLFEDKPFDLKFKVCADKEWQLYQIDRGVLFKPMNFPISKVMVEGFSSAHVGDFEKETRECVEKYCKNIAWVYNVVDILKKNRVAVSFFRFIEKVFFKG
jgi:glycosyltransferase involved in cell wall biosynthesis